MGKIVGENLYKNRKILIHGLKLPEETHGYSCGRSRQKFRELGMWYHRACHLCLRTEISSISRHIWVWWQCVQSRNYWVGPSEQWSLPEHSTFPESTVAWDVDGDLHPSLGDTKAVDVAPSQDIWYVLRKESGVWKVNNNSELFCVYIFLVSVFSLRPGMIGEQLR